MKVISAKNAATLPSPSLATNVSSKTGFGEYILTTRTGGGEGHIARDCTDAPSAPGAPGGGLVVVGVVPAAAATVVVAAAMAVAVALIANATVAVDVVILLGESPSLNRIRTI